MIIFKLIECGVVIGIEDIVVDLRDCVCIIGGLCGVYGRCCGGMVFLYVILI